MKNKTKLFSKFAVLLATLGAGATLASAHVSAHADDGWAEAEPSTGKSYAPGLTDAEKREADKIGSQPESEANKRADAKVQAALDKLDAKYDKQQAAYEVKMEKLAKQNHVKDYGNGTNEPTTTTSTTTSTKKSETKATAKKSSEKKASAKKTTKKHAKKATKKVTKKHVKKSSAKKATKKVAKKHVKKATVKKAAKKHARKHAKRLFRIRVKAHKIYAYKNIKLQKQGRKSEKKGTKLYVYGIIKKGHKTFYKVYGGRVITASKSAVTKINNYVSRVIV
ncbi:hypothetical protein [Apilactobacillus kunkeei]|uniref:hypothetical protein n=1 Tax=Apilactobacillus kunkeei TaxID=148814 RepID=UPI00167D1050|nr:hypothetical protein [Apilactobacillus kunkeei]